MAPLSFALEHPIHSLGTCPAGTLTVGSVGDAGVPINGILKIIFVIIEMFPKFQKCIHTFNTSHELIFWNMLPLGVLDA